MTQYIKVCAEAWKARLILQRSLGCTTAHIPATISTEPHKLLVKVQKQGEESVRVSEGKR